MSRMVPWHDGRRAYMRLNGWHHGPRTASNVPGHGESGDAAFAALKDVRLCLEEAAALGVPMTLGSSVEAILAATCEKFGPDSDCTNIARTVEQRADCEITPNRGSKS